MTNYRVSLSPENNLTR